MRWREEEGYLPCVRESNNAGDDPGLSLGTGASGAVDLAIIPMDTVRKGRGYFHKTLKDMRGQMG